jgi:truncated hemoglobin YjbI
MLQNDMNPPWSTHPERPMNEWLTLLVEAESILGAHRLAAIFTGPWLVPVRVSLAAWRCCSSVRHEGYERLIVALHHGVMALTPEQHSQIAAVYDKAAADYMVPAPQRAAFARKAEMFRMLARLGAKPKSAPPQRASAPANESADN